MAAGLPTVARRRAGKRARLVRDWPSLESLSHLPREQVLGKLLYAAKQPLFAMPFYGLSLSAPASTRLATTLSDPWPGNAEIGRAMADGVFHLQGQTIERPQPLWAPREAGASWRRALHGFEWLRDLRAVGGDRARRAARELVSSWIEHYGGDWNALAWHPAVTGRRVGHWLGHYELFAANASVEFRHRLLYEIARQARHMTRVLPAGMVGSEAIAACKGLILAGLCLPGCRDWARQGLALLRREVHGQLRADGGQVERSPRKQFEVLRDLIDLRAALNAAEAHVPPDLGAAIEQMAPVLRLLQHGDGGLALFNDSREGNGIQVDMVLQRAGGSGRPMESAPQSGFQRLQSGRTLVLVDAGAPPGPGFDGQAHAGTLSIEVSDGRERLIVNCGAHPSDPTWRGVQRGTAAHSTAVVDDVNSSELARDGALRRRPMTVVCRREEAEDNLWLDMSHDGYAKRLGLIHRRRLFLAAGGDDLRGEDLIEGRGGRFFAIRFHLHPNVQASVAQGGDTVLLRLHKGGGWRLRAGGAAPRLEESVYLGDGSAQPRRSLQIVLSGPLTPPETTVKWALRRESRDRA